MAGEKELPYGLTTAQFLAMTDAVQKLRAAAEALKFTAAREHAHETGHAADMLDFCFPEIKRHWDRLVDSERQAFEREREAREC